MPDNRTAILLTTPKARIVCFLLILLCSNQAFCSPEELLKAKNEVTELVESTEPEKVNTVLENYIVDFKKNRTTDQEFSELMKFAYDFIQDDQPGYVEVLFAAGDRLQKTYQFKEAYSFLYKVARIEEHDSLRVKRICRFYEVMGHSYFFFGRLKKAEEMFDKGIRCEHVSEKDKISMLNTMGLIYNRYQNIKEAESYFIRASNLAQQENDIPWYGVISGNLGLLYYLKKDITNAQKFLEIDYRLSLENGQWTSAINALSLLARVDLSTDDIKGASQKIQRLDSLMNIYSNDVSHIEYYRAKTDFFEYTGDFEHALINYRKLKQHEDSMRRASDLTTIQNIEFQLEFERKQSEIKALRQKRKADTVRIISLLSGLILLIIGASIVIWQISKRRKQEHQLLELKNQRIRENMERVEEDLNTALQNLMEKNEIVFALHDEIQQWQDKVDDTQREELSEKINSHLLLTDEGWHKFRRLFDQRFEGFLAYFETTYPDLTNAEIRIIVLIKLNLGSTEMSKALGIGVDSVRKTNLRLRKKLGILDQKELKTLIHSV